MAQIIELTDANFEEVIKSFEAPVLVDFWAPWCGPCRIMAPVMEEIAQKFQKKIKVAKINVDDNPAVASRYEVRSIPTFILFEKGEVKKTVVGAMNTEKLIEELGI